MPRVRNSGQYGMPKYNQATKIVARFGSESKLAALIGVSRVSIYRWQMRRPVGTDGLVPAHQIEKIKAVARLEGVLLRDSDWTPETNVWSEATLQIAGKTRTRKSIADLLA